MQKTMFWCFLNLLIPSSFGQTVCPKHIEVPIYPPTAHIARLQASISLKVTIGAEGNVARAEVANDLAHGVNPVLEKAAIDNIQKWTFEKPAVAPVTHVIVYEYKMDPSLPPIDRNHGSITKVNFDLPDRVTILGNEAVAQPGQSKKKH